jgi:hypothetical protein
MSQPAFATKQKQPLRGILHILFNAVIAVVVGPIIWMVAGAGVNPPAPMLAMYSVCAVAVTFWLTIMWGGWPFTSISKNPLVGGLTVLIAAYAITLGLFKIFFNYEFMQGAPVYVASLDPHGMFNGWSAMVFFVTFLVGLFGLLHFDLWPLTSSPSIMKQPTLGIVWTLLALAVAAILFGIGVNGLGMDPAIFMVKVPVPFIFGTIVTLNMLQGSLFAKMKQPVKGLASVVAAVIIGEGLAAMYGALAPVVSGDVKSGPPAYDFEIWLASALLAVTFPFLIFYADYFKMWPLKKDE